MTLEDINADVAAVTEELGAHLALARYGFDPQDASEFALVAGGSARGAVLILHGAMVGAAYMEQLMAEQTTKEEGS